MRAVIWASVVLLILGVVALNFAGCGSDSAVTQGIDTSAQTRAAVPHHLEGLKSSDAKVRREAALTLWKIGREAPEAAPRLLETIHDPDPQVREAVLRALARTGWQEKGAVAAIVPLLEDEDAEVRARAAASLAELG